MRALHRDEMKQGETERDSVLLQERVVTYCSYAAFSGLLQIIPSQVVSPRLTKKEATKGLKILVSVVRFRPWAPS